MTARRLKFAELMGPENNGDLIIEGDLAASTGWFNNSLVQHTLLEILQSHILGILQAHIARDITGTH